MAKFKIQTSDLDLVLNKFTWQTWSPTVTGSPANPSSTVNYAKYLQIGKRVFFNFDISINSTVGASGGFSLFVTSPHTMNEANAEPLGTGRELLISGKQLMVNKNSASQFLITSHDIISLLVSGYRVACSGSYRVS